MIARSYYDPQTGLVVCCQTLYGGGEATVPMPGLAVIEALSEPGRHYVVAGEVRDLPPQPDPHHVWDLASESWVDPRTPEQVAADGAAALEAARTAALARALDLRFKASARYITVGEGQSERYGGKALEARAFMTDPNPAEAEYPLIWSEVGVTAETPYEVAQIFMNLDLLWRTVGGAIDRAYFGTQAAIMAATSDGEMQAALDALAGALNA